VESGECVHNASMQCYTMRLHPGPFERVKSGEKNVECRLNDEKRQQLAVGDTIVFQNRSNDETVERKVVALHTFPDFKSMFKKFPEEKINDIYQYYTPEEEKECGVVAIELK
jgi:ASC-1-like (ASCH) protein